MKLVAISKDGNPETPLGPLPPMARDILEETASLYKTEGYAKPWVGYIAVEDDRCVGFCAFKSQPADGAVEIAYAAMPDCEGSGVATRMARRLIAMAREREPDIILRAQTLPQEGASTAVLRKCGFACAGEADHPEDGRVWEWRLAPAV